MNYVNEFENPEMELENYAGKIWEIAKQVHKAPQASNLRNSYIAAARAFGRRLGPGIAGGTGGGTGLRNHADRRVHFYRKVIRNAANYLNAALLKGHRHHPGKLVRHAFNRASNMVAAQTGTPGVPVPRFSTGATTSITSGPYQSATRGAYGTSYTSGIAPAATGPTGRPVARRAASPVASRPHAGIHTGGYPAGHATTGHVYPYKRGKYWTGGGAFHPGTTTYPGTTTRAFNTSSQTQGRWTKKGNMLILHGLSKNIAYS
jgi:hypothetical protein